MSKLKVASAYIITHYKSWTDNLRSREFTLAMAATVTSTALLCEWAKVPDAKRMYVIAFVTALAGFCYMLNPKSVGWVTEVPGLLKLVADLRAQALLAAQPTNADYDALTEHLPESTRTTVAQQLTVVQEVTPAAPVAPAPEDPAYQNSSAEVDPLYHNSADTAPAQPTLFP